VTCTELGLKSGNSLEPYRKTTVLSMIRLGSLFSVLIQTATDWTRPKSERGFDTYQKPMKTATAPYLPARLVALAKQEVGIEEVGATNCGPRVNEYKAATWLPADKPWPWCAAFICWLVREAMKGREWTFERPETAGAWDFENWSRKQDKSTWTKKPTDGDIQAGDIVVFTFSHIGLAIGPPDKNGNVPTIEGNTDAAGSREGGGVFKKLRPLLKIRSRIRFTV